MLPSVNPPGGLSPQQVPQFVMFASDDNARTNGNKWLVNLFSSYNNPPGTGNVATYDGMRTRATFFVIGKIDRYGKDVARSMAEAYRQGHEIGNHTYAHEGESTYEEWLKALADGNAVLTRPTDKGGLGVPADQIFGFRAPEDAYNPALFRALVEAGFTYDASIIEGYQTGKNGTNEFWPYTLDEGSPAATWMYKSGFRKSKPPEPTPGLWELPENVFRVPAELQKRYGTRVYGCDWNWVHDNRMAKEDMVTIFKYNLDLRLGSNRAPLQLCLHSQYYGYEKWFTDEARASIDAMQAALTEMVEYALSKPEVRLVSGSDLVKWMRDPVPLNPPS